MMEREYLNLIRLLNDEGVEYVIVGGHAVIAHGYLRTTVDVDIFVNPNPDNAARLLRVMNRYGYTNGEFEADDFIRVPSYLSFSRNNYYVDMMTSTPGVTFDECYQNRLLVSVDGLTIPFIGRKELIHNKQAVGRLQDWQDVTNLTAPTDDQGPDKLTDDPAAA